MWVHPVKQASKNISIPSSGVLTTRTSVMFPLKNKPVSYGEVRAFNHRVAAVLNQHSFLDSLSWIIVWILNQHHLSVFWKVNMLSDQSTSAYFVLFYTFIYCGLCCVFCNCNTSQSIYLFINIFFINRHYFYFFFFFKNIIFYEIWSSVVLVLLCYF